jgi:hypothetical protein
MGAEAAEHVRRNFTDAAMRVKLCAYLDEAAGSRQSDSALGSDNINGKSSDGNEGNSVNRNRIRVQRFMRHRVTPLLWAILFIPVCLLAIVVAATYYKLRGNTV